MSLYVSQQKSELLDSLENQVRFSQLVAVLVGARGLGKSFLLEQLHGRLKDEVAIANVDASMAMSDDQLDKTISLQLGLSWQSSNSELATRISNTHSEKVLISIDNAHLLSASCLEFLLKLNQSQLSDKQSSLFILLAGENSLPALINKTTTFSQHPEMCVVFELEPIQQSETRAIVDTFCHPNSEVLKELKNGSKLDYFWQLAKGNPAELNYHMSRWLDEHSPTEVVEIETKIKPNAALKAMVYSILAITLSTMLVYQDEINQWISPPADEKKALGDNSLNSDNALNSDTPTKIEDSKQHLRDKLEVTPKGPIVQTEANNRKTETGTEANQQFEKELAEAEKANDSKQATPIDTEEVAAEQTKLAELSHSEKSRKTKKLENVNTPSPEVQRQSTAEEDAKLTKPDSVLTQDEQFLLAQKNSSYVLQWVGVSSLDAAQKYRDTHLAKEQMRVYRRANKGSTLFIIVSDRFSNRALAEFALNDYLQQGVKEKPWIKSLELVHKEIKQFELSDN